MKYTLNLATRSYVNRRNLYLCYALLGALLVIVLMFNLWRFFSLRSEISDNEINKKISRSNSWQSPELTLPVMMRAAIKKFWQYSICQRNITAGQFPLDRVTRSDGIGCAAGCSNCEN